MFDSACLCLNLFDSTGLCLTLLNSALLDLTVLAFPWHWLILLDSVYVILEPFLMSRRQYYLRIVQPDFLALRQLSDLVSLTGLSFIIDSFTWLSLGPGIGGPRRVRDSLFRNCLVPLLACFSSDIILTPDHLLTPERCQHCSGRRGCNHTMRGGTK